MKRSIHSAKKSSRGRPPVDSEAVNVRLQRPLLNALDKFIADEKDDQSSRPHAIRLILDDWLKVHSYLKVTVENKVSPKAK